MKYLLLPFVFPFVFFKNLFSKRDKPDNVKFKESILAVKQTGNKKEFIK